MTNPLSVADRLRQARLVAGLNQRQLANRSGVSERTIRGLEAGTIREPRRGTVLALVPHLHLPGQEIASVLDALGLRERRELDVSSLFGPGGAAHRWPEVLRAQTHLLQETARLSVWSIDAQGRNDSVEVWRDFRCLADGVDRLFGAWGFDQQLVDPSLVQIEGRNCRGGRRFSADHDAVVLELLFDQRLMAGDSFGCGYRVEFANAFVDRGGPPNSEAIDVLGAPGVTLSSRVHFTSSALPASVWTVENRAPDRPRTEGQSITLSPFHIARFAPTVPVVEANGICWAWPD